MFAADPRVTHIPAAREQIAAIHASLNKPHIAVPGKQAQEVQAWLVGVGVGGAFSVFVYLFLAQSVEAVVYVDHERLRVDANGYRELEAEALGFLESMGFMMEGLNFRALSLEQQVELMGRLPCFTKDLQSLTRPAATQAAADQHADPPQLRLARLLASF